MTQVYSFSYLGSWDRRVSRAQKFEVNLSSSDPKKINYCKIHPMQCSSVAEHVLRIRIRKVLNSISSMTEK